MCAYHKARLRLVSGMCVCEYVCKCVCMQVMTYCVRVYMYIWRSARLHRVGTYVCVHVGMCICKDVYMYALHERVDMFVSAEI